MTALVGMDVFNYSLPNFVRWFNWKTPFFLLLYLLFWGCAPVEVRLDYLQSGFDYTNMGYVALPNGLPLNEKIELDNLKVHIVGSLDAYKKNKFKKNEVGMNTDPQRKREIWAVGKELNGKIIINQLILGEELLYLIHLNRPDVICPCELEAFEACIIVHPPLFCN